MSVYDAYDLYTIPGLIDAHMHIEPTMLLPSELAKLLLPRSVTALFADPYELGNVLGSKGIEVLLSLSKDVPLHIFIQVPSRLPTAPGLETTGGVLGVKEVEELLNIPNAVSLGELNYQNLLSLKKEYLEKIEIALEKGKVVNGHAPKVVSSILDAIAAAHIMDDHESVSGYEALEKLRRGIAIMVREGTTERNAEELIKHFTLSLKDFSNVLFSTDDKHPEDIAEEGHIDFIVRKAVDYGLDPIEAIMAATYNIARHFRLDHLLGSIAPGRYADIVLVKDLKSLQVKSVFFGGKLYYNNGTLIWKPGRVEIPTYYLKTIKLPSMLRPENLELEAPCSEGWAKVRVIEIVPGQIVNNEVKTTLQIKNNTILSDPIKDVAKIAVIERYGKDGSIGKAFAKGFGLKHGSIASSVAHDHHNIVIIGHNSKDMLIAAKHLEKIGGGFVAVLNEQVLADVPLPFAGLLSIKSVEEVIGELKRINEVARMKLGITIKSPFMQLEFVTLPSVPELGITNKGLILVERQSLINPVLSIRCLKPESTK